MLPFDVGLLSTILCWAVATTTAAHLARDDGSLSQKPQQPDFSGFDLLDIPAPPYNLTPFPLPSKCANFSAPAPAGDTDAIECPSSMLGYAVFYDDCESAWTICHCITANITIIEAADHLARIPVGLRRNIDTVMILPAPFETSTSQKSWVHESTHASDNGHAESQAWAEAVGNDSCVPDIYSQTNLIEDFAQTSVLEAYRVFHGELPPGFSTDCMSHQFAYMDSLSLYNKTHLFGDTCAIVDDWTPSAVHINGPPFPTNDAAVISGSYTDYTEIPNPTAAVWVDGVPPNQGDVIITASAVVHTPFAFAPSASDAGKLEATKPPQSAAFTGFDLLDIPAPPYRLSQLSDLPNECANLTGSGASCPSAMIGYSAGYDDCASPWTVCHCITSNITIIEAVEHLARIPVGLRRNIGTVMVFPGPMHTGTSFTVGRDMHFFGVCSQRAWIHNSVLVSDNDHSTSQGWLDAVDADSCVPDTPSQTNSTEDFAQTGVLEVYRLLHGDLPLGFSADCMANQLAYVGNLSLFNKTTLFGGTCGIVDDWTPSAPHTVGPAFRVSGDTVLSGSYTDYTGIADPTVWVDGASPTEDPGTAPFTSRASATEPAPAPSATTKTSGGFGTNRPASAYTFAGTIAVLPLMIMSVL
ncbi:hypothetical protein PUNSTDRAFT_127630 [Punctularia strigosozonata HHB-11173 SS5]|uniref:uncharacterized protein n=1 Tax=Punctularia strigosozonata (strain HHB-11173) TaxID=741275 RepID=UPI000441679B|nr:uncharacterized protein PUNSTDRAFT_127630 [Punctularia strigosozonata HHB-11173 SS5]EIN06297.1 hypothetical protein PUNSTDRAFT_127630 [Punctularia strigosozonata HHB-11173 SS5]